ncbi:MAG: hypothetical protein IKS70_03990 [Bacteroides sp.]|nr:hypothetical protein [Bacteroides sp.]
MKREQIRAPVRCKQPCGARDIRPHKGEHAVAAGAATPPQQGGQRLREGVVHDFPKATGVTSQRQQARLPKGIRHDFPKAGGMASRRRIARDREVVARHISDSFLNIHKKRNNYERKL